MHGERELIIYEPRKVLDFVEEKGSVTPHDLKELGYDPDPALQIIFWMCFDGYLKDMGRKYIRPPAQFETESGEIKKVAGGRTSNAYGLTEKGKCEKPEPGVVQTISGVTWNKDAIVKGLFEGTPEERKEIEVVIRGLVERGIDALTKYFKNREKE